MSEPNEQDTADPIWHVMDVFLVVGVYLIVKASLNI